MRLLNRSLVPKGLYLHARIRNFKTITYVIFLVANGGLGFRKFDLLLRFFFRIKEFHSSILWKLTLSNFCIVRNGIGNFRLDTSFLVFRSLGQHAEILFHEKRDIISQGKLSSFFTEVL